MKRRDMWMAGAMAIGMAAAFMAGMTFAGLDSDGESGPTGPAGESRGRSVPQFRKFYSPNISSDPYVLDQQRRVVEALELQCSTDRQHCPEAQQARRWMDKQEPD